MKKVFLGGTCNESKWREELISMLEIDYFNPVVDDWNEEAMKEELHQREHCDYCLYVITPRMTGVYSIAEVVDDSNKRPEKTIFCVLEVDSDGREIFSSATMRSIIQVKEMVKRNGGTCCDTLAEVAEFLNRNL